MDPNLWFNGAHFEDLVIWSPSATGYYSDHLDFLTHGFSSFGVGSSQDMVQFDQEVTTSFGDLAYTLSPHTLSIGAGMDIGNNPQGTTSHQLVVGPSSSSSGPQRCESEIPRPRVEDRAYRRFTIQDVKKLIQGVEKHGRRWKYIKLEFFEDSPRKKDQLKEKWRHMLKSANTQTDPMRKELYSWAKNLDATLPK